MKPRIFIGSSAEGLEVAKKVKEYFDEDYICHIWDEGIFKENENFLETLIKSASLFDFGFLIFSKDDVTIKRHTQFASARDNVMFEYGLFLGRLGVKRAYIIAENGVDIPSDLLGITFCRYSIYEDDTHTRMIDMDGFNQSMGGLKRNIDEKVRFGYLGLLPSTIIAISYFDNFVSLVANWIKSGEPKIATANGLYKKALLYVVLPDNLDSDIKKHATVFYNRKGLKDIKMDTVHRNYPLHASSSSDREILSIYDIPTILNGLDKAIDLYFSNGYIGKTQEQKLTEIYEMENFERVLNILIERDSFCKECVIIEHESKCPK